MAEHVFFNWKLEYVEGAVIVKEDPVDAFLTTTCCAMRGFTNATTVANNWNANFSTLRAMFTKHELEEISRDTA